MQALSFIRTRILPLISLSLLVGTIANAADGKIHKWVDDKGVTHYGDKMPAKDVHRDNSVLNNQGVVIKRNQISNTNKHEVDVNVIEQRRRDRALRASYTNEEEIDLARDRSLQMDEVSIQALEQRKVSALKRLETNQKNIDGFNKREKPVPEDLSKDASDIKAEIARIDDQIAHRKSSMDATRKRFNEDKRRFIEIKAEQN
ncbi:MAG: DUF4124 domain-containing protein [Nitrosomonadales bacterium]|nr:DUF4124 domain-containing protein [Nitrosomonadales bacterium]